MEYATAASFLWHTNTHMQTEEVCSLVTAHACTWASKQASKQASRHMRMHLTLTWHYIWVDRCSPVQHSHFPNSLWLAHKFTYCR